MKMFKILGFATVCLSLGLAAACGDDSGSSASANTDDDGGGGSAAAGGMGGSSSSSTGGSAPTCDGPGFAFDMIDSAVGTIGGTIQTETGAPASEILSDVCGTNICLNGETDASGVFSTVGAGQSIIDVRLIYGTGVKYVQMTAFIDDPTGFDFGVINTVELPPIASGVAMDAGASATSAGVTIDVPAGASLKYDIVLFPTPAEQGFRATVFTPADGTFPAIPASLNLQGLVATAPMNTEICPGATLTVPNTFGFAAGAQVEVLYHGTNILTAYAPYGGWTPVAVAEVSGDGANIEFKDGESVEELGLFGFRALP